MAAQTQILLLQTGDAVPSVERKRGGFYSLFEAGLCTSSAVVLKKLDLRFYSENDRLPDLAAYDGVVMTGSPAMVAEDTTWMRYGVRVIRAILERKQPFLGVCFGHQLLGVATGAEVGPNPLGRMMGTVTVTLEDADSSALWRGMPRHFAAQVSHVDVIRKTSPALRVLGRSPHDACHVVQANPLAWGVQFHPEFDVEVMRQYLDARRGPLDEEQGTGTAARRLSEVGPAPMSTGLLARFSALCANPQLRASSLEETIHARH